MRKIIFEIFGIHFLEFDVKWFSEIYKDKSMKKRLREVESMKKRLDKLFKKSKTDRDEITQLVVKNFERDEGMILQELHEK